MGCTLLVVAQPRREVAGDSMAWRPGFVSSVRSYGSPLGRMEDPRRGGNFWVLDVPDLEPASAAFLAKAEGPGNGESFAAHLRPWRLVFGRLPAQVQRQLRSGSRAGCSWGQLQKAFESPRDGRRLG